jgi:hypothetical protein
MRKFDWKTGYQEFWLIFKCSNFFTILLSLEIMLLLCFYTILDIICSSTFM